MVNLLLFFLFHKGSGFFHMLCYGFPHCFPCNFHMLFVVFSPIKPMLLRNFHISFGTTNTNNTNKYTKPIVSFFFETRCFFRKILQLYHRENNSLNAVYNVIYLLRFLKKLSKNLSSLRCSIVGICFPLTANFFKSELQYRGNLLFSHRKLTIKDSISRRCSCKFVL